MITIGLTGENCAGKGTMAEYLKKKSFYYLSLSDIIREELAKKGREITRQNLINMGNEMRKKHGEGILAKKAIERMEPGRNYVVDSIRNPAEVLEFRKRKNFLLVHVYAPPRLRFERMKARGREDDPRTYEAFLEIEKLEMESPDKSGQKLLECIKMADRKIVNDSTFNRFYERIDSFLCDVTKICKFTRPSWDEYFMSIAKVVAGRSNCIKRQVAAIIVKDRRIISTGYNGTPRGTRNCNEGGCPRCNNFVEGGKGLEECYCSHAEENAIVQAAYHGISVKGGTLYSTYSPCLLCSKMIINAGIKEVVYNADYPLAESARKLMEEAGVKVRRFRMED